MNIMWVKVESWHIKKAFWPWAASYMVETVCGLQREWDGTEIDRLPGGDEKSCENCLRILARGVDEQVVAAPPEPEPVPAPKRTRKSK